MIRIFALAVEPVDTYRTRTTRNSGLFNALERRHELVGVDRPLPPAWEDLLVKARYVHRDRDTWRTRASLSPQMYARRTAAAARILARHPGQYDVILQLQTVFAPGRRPPRPYVVYTDNTYSLTARYYPRWAPLGRREHRRWLELERETCRAAAFLFPKSDFVRRAMIEDYGCDPELIATVGGGANAGLPTLEGRRWDAGAALFVGVDFERKGGHVLLDAWPEVRRRLPGAELWVVGPGTPAAETDGVVWHGHVADRAALDRLYARASCFVMPSLFEPFGLVFLEANGHGLACIGTDHCAMPEIIEDGVTGLLVPPGEAEPLSDALVALLGDPVRAESMGRAAHTRTRAGHTWDDVVDRMTPGLERAVNGG